MITLLFLCSFAVFAIVLTPPLAAVYLLVSNAAAALRRKRRITRMRRAFRENYIAWKDHGDPVAKLSVEQLACQLLKLGA